MSFPVDFLDRLRAALPISSVIGKSLPLKRAGQEWHALCPFHQEKTPSFTINDRKGFYHCFGCGAHGDAIRFLQEYRKLSFLEAVEQLAGEAGLTMPERKREAPEAIAERLKLYQAMEAAARWFTRQLYGPSGHDARIYLQKRGTEDRMIAEFRLGLAPDSRDGLKRTLLSQGFDEKTLLKVGLLIPADMGSYDRFRNRLIFPICDMKGRVIAFGGRILGEGQPKYLNSPETELFQKRETLYGLDKARMAIKADGQLFVVEGYMDVIALHQAGLANAVAPLGTALTSDHMARIWRHAQNPVLCFDGDFAGMKAAERAAQLALPVIETGASIGFMSLPEKEDPDTLIKAYGVESFLSIAKKAQTLAEFLWDSTSKRFDLARPEQKAAAEKALMDLAAQMRDKRLASYFTQYFRDHLFKRGNAKAAPQTITPEVRQSIGNRQSLRQSLEERMLALVIHVPLLLERPEVEEKLAHLDLANPALTALRDQLLELFHETPDIGSAILAPLLEQKGFGKILATFPSLKGEQEMFRELWRELETNHHLCLLEEEYQETALRMASECTEPMLERIAQLQSQIAELKLKAS